MPRRLTRGEADALASALIAEARRAAVTPELDLLELAWGVIANAGWDGSAKTPGWQEAAVRWRDQYHALLAGHRPPGPPAPWWRRLAGLRHWRIAQADDPVGLVFRCPGEER